MEPLPVLTPITAEDVVNFIRNDETMQREMLQQMIFETIIEFRKKQQAQKGIVLDEFNPQVRESAAEEARRLLEEGLTFGDFKGGKSRKSKTRKHKSRKHKSRKSKSRKH